MPSIKSILLLSFVAIHLSQANDCDRMIISKDGHPKDGVFTAPQIVNEENHSRQCLFTFVAKEGERVKIQFRKFGLRGTPPDGSTLGLTPACNHEYLDIFTEIKTPDSVDLLNTPFGGRYCGRIPPRLRITLHRVAAIAFYTDYNTTGSELFKGSYKFFNASKYNVGTSGAESDCGYIVHADMKKSGGFMSPTYPGSYPKSLSCYWKFSGNKGQRIRIEFRDFDLFFGGKHCPFDQVRLYDGPDQGSPLIGTYCGQQRHLVVFSTGKNMMITLTTLARIADTQNRGFQAIFNFSESYLSLEFIHKNEAKFNDAEHIRGTECDQKILSKGESNGTVFSPNFPYPYGESLVCKYFIYGLEDAQNLERVRLSFVEKFFINSSSTAKSNCSDAYLRLYLRGQEVESKYDEPDYELCGKQVPEPVQSSGPRLLMVFNSGNRKGLGFIAKYRFQTEYMIAGTPVPDGKCMFTYYSSSFQSGTFNSPRHPANYPSNTSCTFSFMPRSDEQAQVVFDQFKVKSEDSNYTFGNHCTNDYVEVYNLYKSSGPTGETKKINGRYCGEVMPGPSESERDAIGLRVVLHTDHTGVSSGFDADFLFKKKHPYFRDCGSNITHKEWGELTSPNYPEYYGSSTSKDFFTCDWFIYVRPNHKILLWFHDFAVEGNLDIRGCPAAVVKVWRDLGSTPMEICGEGLTPALSQIISVGNVLRISFTTAPKAVGNKGFKAIWTEIQARQKCDQFLCTKNNFCISKQLRCNGIPNCGIGDHSDESRCTKASEVNVPMFAGLGMGVSTAIVIVICIWCHRKRARRREAKSMPHHVHVCERGARFAAMDSNDRNLSPVLGTRKAPHHLSCSSLRTETVV